MFFLFNFILYRFPALLVASTKAFAQLSTASLTLFSYTSRQRAKAN